MSDVLSPVILDVVRRGGKWKTHLFTASGTWPRPDGVEVVEVELLGGGGAGGSASGSTAGGSSSFGSVVAAGGLAGGSSVSFGSGGVTGVTFDSSVPRTLISIKGANGGTGGTGASTPAQAGNRSPSPLNGIGGPAGTLVVNSSYNRHGGGGGAASFGNGGSGGNGESFVTMATAVSAGGNATGFGSGGGGGGGVTNVAGSHIDGCGGGGAGEYISSVRVPVSGDVSVIVGAGGVGGAGSSSRGAGGNGAPGFVRVYWQE